jgi:hypothetical protein
MLARLSIRDIVLIDRLDIDFASGLSVLTGETGAGKSILLDAFALALGARGDAALVRQGADQGQVTAMFELSASHPARAQLRESGIATDEALILRRLQFSDGRTRAFVNDQPVSVQVLQNLGSALVEIHGQHDARALVDTQPIAACSMPMAGSKTIQWRLSSCGVRGAKPKMRLQNIAPRSSARRGRPNGCATPPRNWPSSRPCLARKPRWRNGART